MASAASTAVLHSGTRPKHALRDLHDRVTGYADGAYNYTPERHLLRDFVKDWYEGLCADGRHKCKEKLAYGQSHLLCKKCVNSLDYSELTKVVQAAIYSWHGPSACVHPVSVDLQRLTYELAFNLIQNGCLFEEQDELLAARNRSEREEVWSIESKPCSEADLPGEEQCATQEVCTICQEIMEVGCKMRTQSCGHSFHSACLYDWSQKKTSEGLVCANCTVVHDPKAQAGRVEPKAKRSRS